MPWNEPGGNGKNNDPWGNKNNPSPPDLDKVISDFIKKLRGAFSVKKNSSGAGNNQQPSSFKWKKPVISPGHRYGFAITAGILLVLWFVSGFYIVNPAEEAVILRLGQYSTVQQPGLHWMARLIDTKYMVDIQKIYSFPLQGDFLTKSSEQNDLPNQYVPTTGKTSNDQSKNLVNVELNVQYRISDPRSYLFNTVNPDETVDHVAAGALSDVIGKMKLDEVLTTGRELLSAGVLERTREVLKKYKPGIDVLSVTLRKVQAPDQVRVAFSDVNRADQDRATFIQQAQAYASKVVPLAQGVAARTLADANGYQQQVVLAAKASVAKYQSIQKVYAMSPDVTRERMYLETMQNIFTRSTKILIDGNSGNNMLYLPLDKLIKQTKQSELSLDDTMRFKYSQMVATNQQNSPEVKNVTN